MRTSLAVLLGVLALAGCGDSGGPPIDREVAVKLARQADAIAAARNPCSARTHARILQRQTIAAINAGRIPPVYLETLQSRVNEIAAAFELRCLPTPAPASAESSSPPPVVAIVPEPVRSHGRRHEKEKHHGKHHKEHDD